LFPRGFQVSELVPINFNFKYFGESFSEMIIYSNGMVIFGSTFTFLGNNIYALLCDFDTTSSGGIYYQNLNSQSSDFNSIKSDLNRLNTSFVPTNLFRITYDKVPVKSNSSLLTSFQIVLASDVSKSYVLLKYIKCSYDVLYSSLTIYYLLNGQQKIYQYFNNPCTDSNVNQVGTWVFDVTSIKSKQKFQFLQNTNVFD
jgi:hypothetical protein